MTIYACPDCDGDVSGQAKACPNCGMSFVGHPNTGPSVVIALAIVVVVPIIIMAALVVIYSFLR